MKGGAEISDDGDNRYALWRVWDDGPMAAFVMLNPSTADATVDDPTIRRCVGYAKRWGFGSTYVVNLFAYRATNPRELLDVIATKGPVEYIVDDNNDAAIRRALDAAQQIVAAWGASGGAAAAYLGTKLLEDYPHMMALGLTKDGYPRHPLYMPKAIDVADLVRVPRWRVVPYPPQR